MELFAERVANRGLCAQTQAESIKYKLLGTYDSAGKVLVPPTPVRRAASGVVRFVMESGAKGCEVIVSGKLRGQRAKAAKFHDGYMIKTGQAAK